jgi:hypothetical protein
LREDQVPKPKKPAHLQAPPAWEVYRVEIIACRVGVVHAPDKASAIATAIEEHKVRPADQKRLLARPR